jgi:prepilin-type N-terminal cleavage/methylation domain-containing protein
MMKRSLKQSVAGFTLIEMIVVVAFIGILMAIAAPSWLGFLNRQRLNTAQSEIVTAMREAQANAKRQKRNWEVCFQDKDGKVRWAVRPSPNIALNCDTDAGAWNNLSGSDANKIEMTPPTVGMRFQKDGWLDLQTHTQTGGDNSKNVANSNITLMVRNQKQGSKRCVYVATLLGAMGTAADNDCNNQ